MNRPMVKKKCSQNYTAVLIMVVVTDKRGNEMGSGHIIHYDGGLSEPWLVDKDGNELHDGFYDIYMKEHNLVVVNESIQ